MTERRLTLIDVDENPFVVWLKEDRVQLCVIDSRPELEGSELRAFAAALFASYGGPVLVARLEAARGEVSEVRDKLAGAGATDEVVAALDRALCAVADVMHRITAPRPEIAPAGEPAKRWPALTSSSCRLP